MLKKDMKKIFENFYVFSKLALSLTLLICLIGALYILYINYQNEGEISKNNTFFEEELKNNINKNSELINEIINEIKVNEMVLEEIKISIDNLSNKNKTDDISNINDSLELLNNNFNSLSEEIKILKDNNILSSSTDQDKDKIISNSNRDIIDLILIKYENNIDFSEELEYLKKNINKNQLTIIEKILVLSIKTYKGHDYLKTIFDQEVNTYLKKIINKNPDSLFNQVIMPYLKVSPSSENTINDDLILKIKEIKSDIENKNFQNAFNQLKSIKDYQIIFKLSSAEINKYLNFKSELLSLS